MSTRAVYAPNELMIFDNHNPVAEFPHLETLEGASDPAEKLRKLAALARAVSAESLSEEASAVAERVSGGRF